MTLTGKKNNNSFSLIGNQTCSNMVPDLDNIKTSCINVFLLPLQSDNWESPINNKFLLKIHKDKLNNLQAYFNNEDIAHYLEIINLLEILIPLYEKWKQENPDKANNIISMVYTTTMIKIKPEYEIYHQIFGKPDKILGQTYNSKFLIKIQDLMKKENITIEKIKVSLLN